MCLYLIPKTLLVLPKVINMSFVVSVGEVIAVPENILVNIYCGSVIDDTLIEGGIANITWYKNNRLIVNGSEFNVVLAPDN